MKQALESDHLKHIYDATASYYNLYHRLGTYGFDQVGRNILVDAIVKEYDYVLDAGGGTGTTGIKAGNRVGEKGKVVILDLSPGMLEQARKKIDDLKMSDKFQLIVGDMYRIPFPDNTFDAVLSTYSTCPLDDPMNAVREMLRVLRKGGLLGIAHSTESRRKWIHRISAMIEKVIWKFHRLSLGCRNIELIDDIRKLDVTIISDRIIGIIPFFFRILVIQKK